MSECPVSRSPLPPGSPLLVTRAMSPALQRARSFNKELRRQASFRAAREKQSLSRTNSPSVSRRVLHMRGRDSNGIYKLPQIQLILEGKVSCTRGSLQIPLLSLMRGDIETLDFRNPSPEREETVSQQQEMAFRVKKCLGSRKGWKIIPDNDDNSEDINTVALRTVVSMIKDMECQVNKMLLAPEEQKKAIKLQIAHFIGICSSGENFSKSVNFL